jgi:hypothetical protein
MGAIKSPATAGGVDETDIVDARQRCYFEDAMRGATFENFQRNKFRDVGSKFRAIFGGGAGRIALDFGIDEGLRNRRIHCPRRGLPDKVTLVIDTEIFSVSFP